jgi:hypothetical protein
MRRRTSIVSLFAVIVILSCAGCAERTITKSITEAHTEKTQTISSKRLKTSSAQQQLTAAVAQSIRKDGGHAAVAVDDLTTGSGAADGGTKEFVTASIVKVDILSTLLYQRQQARETLTGEDQELATTMIENSDNDSATDLYDDAAGADRIDDANRVFGLRETTVGTSGYWGLTTTTVDDQIRLLRQVFTSSSVLSATSRDYIQDLMSQVEADQQWGVSAAADSGTVSLVKNGWLPNPYLWEINSIGEVVHDRQRMLIAVLSVDNTSEDSGISVVEKIATDAADAIAGQYRRLPFCPVGTSTRGNWPGGTPNKATATTTRAPAARQDRRARRHRRPLRMSHCSLMNLGSCLRIKTVGGGTLFPQSAECPGSFSVSSRQVRRTIRVRGRDRRRERAGPS